MQQNLWIRSRAIVSMLHAEIQHRSREVAADPNDIAKAVLDERTPPGWRYELYPPTAPEGPDFLLIPKAAVGR